MADALTNLLKAINTFEKAEGGNHRYRHISGALREARYAATRTQANANWDSPGQQEAREAAGKAHVPDAVDDKHPTVPEESASNQGSEASDGGSTASVN